MQKLVNRNTISSAALAMVGIGLWMIYPPAALVAVGVILYSTTLLAAIMTKGKEGKAAHD